MADLIKKIKIKKQDGTFTDYIPIGADAVNVETSDGESVELKLNKKPYYYNIVADMKTDTKLKAGDTCQTLGYDSKNDGNEELYNIVDDNSLTTDNYNVIELNNGLKAVKINNKAEIKIHFPYLPHDVVSRVTGSGNCQIIQTQDKNMIIDLGYQESGELLLNYLITNNINKIDYILISHFHDDHIGGGTSTALSTLLNSSSVDTNNCIFILPPSLDSTKFIGSSEYNKLITKESNIKGIIQSKNLNYIIPTENQEIILDNNTKVKIMNTVWGDDYYNSTIDDNSGTDTGITQYNNFSLVVELVHKKIKGLFPADIETVAQEKLYENLNDYDFYVVAHHSANTNVNRKYIARVKPKTCAIVESMESFYLSGHSGNKIKKERIILQTLEVPIYCTYESGNIIIDSDGYKIKVTSENGNYIAENQNNDLLLKTAFAINNEFFLNLGNNEDLNDIKDGSWTTTTDAIGNTIQNQPILNHGGFRVTQGNINNQYKKYQCLQYSRNDEFGFWYRVQYTTLENGEIVSHWNNWVNISSSVDFLLANQSDRIPANSNLNDYIKPNVYKIAGSDMTSIVNKPYNVGYGCKLIVISANDLRYIKQIAIPGYIPSSVSSNPNTMFVRSYFTLDGTTYQWSDWSQIG